MRWDYQLERGDDDVLDAIRSLVGVVSKTVSGLPSAGSEATDGAGPAWIAENASGR